jgi:hypothetical protein
MPERRVRLPGSRINFFDDLPSLLLIIVNSANPASFFASR